MSRRRLWSGAGAALLAAAVVVGCGSDGGAFDASVAEVRAAIDAGDREAATAALDALAIQALAAHEEGTVTDAELDEVRQLIDSSRILLDEVLPPTTTTPPPPTEPPPADRDDDEDDDDKDDEKEEKEKDKRKGRDKDDDKDD